LKKVVINLCVILINLTIPVIVFAQATYYVDPINGSDGNNGTSTNKAFRTIFQARNAVRCKIKTMTGDIIIYLKGGIYQLDSALTLSSADSGTNGYKITYQQYQCEKPVISGGVRITGWTLHDPLKNIFKAVVEEPIESRQLYVNALRAIRARTIDASDWYEEGDGYHCPTEVSTWKNISDVEVVSHMVWKCHRGPISSVNGTHATMAQPYWDNVHVQFSAPPIWIENAYELLDREGEWYLDRSSSTIFYKPRIGEDISTAEVILSKQETLVKGSNVGNITFSGITFAYATWLIPNTIGGFACIQADARTSSPIAPFGFYFWQVFEQVPGNISFNHSSNIKFNSCAFEHLGSTALQFYRGSKNDTIYDNTFRDISGSAISVGSLNDSVPAPDDLVKDNSVTNNLISEVAVEFSGCVGILVGYTDHTVLSHNEIRSLPYTGISLGWGWSNKETIAKNNEISYNLIDSVMTLLDDGGAIYTISAQGGSEIHNNFIKNNLNQPAALYADQGTSYMRWHHNVVDNAPRWMNLWSETSLNVIADFNFYTNPEFVFGGTNCTIENNVYVSNNWPAGAINIMQTAGRVPTVGCHNNIAAVGESRAFRINSYPNPTLGTFHISFDVSFQENYTVKVYDCQGRLLQTALKNKSEIEFELNLNNYPAGLYLIRIAAGNHDYQQKMIKQ